MRRALLLAATAGILGLTATPCWACSCAGQPPLGYTASSDVIFAGTVSAIHANEADFTRLAHFDVDRAFKGDVNREMAVTTGLDSAACGIEFVEGVRYTVFAQRNGASLNAHLCSATQRGDVDAAEFGLVEQEIPGVPASPEASPKGVGPIAVPTTPTSGSRDWIPVVAIVAGAIAVAFVVWWLVRRRRTPGEPAS